MTPHAYLVSLLAGQVMPQPALDTLQRLRGEIETVLRRHFGNEPGSTTPAPTATTR
jgi:hypothetical protein